MPHLRPQGRPRLRVSAAFVSMAKEVDTYPTIAAMADMDGYPTPAEWSTCNVRALR